MEQHISLHEALSIIEDDIRWLSSAAQSLEDLALALPEGEQKSTVELLAACYREHVELRKALLSGRPR